MKRLDMIKTFALALSIVIVLNAFINIGVRTFYTPIEFEDFCGERELTNYTTQESCVENGGKWIPDNVALKGEPVRPVPLTIDGERDGYCDATHECREAYQDARSVYDRNVFIILLIAGIIALFIGLKINAAEAVSSGFVFGGVLSFIIGTMRYWSNMDEYLRFIILGIALIVLIWVGYKKISKND